MKPLTVLMSGPLPPAIGGMASVLAALQASSLPQHVDLRLFDTGKSTPPGRPLWQGIGARLALMARWWTLVGMRPRAVAHIHTCSGLTFFLDGALLLLARLRGASVVLHIHGARFDEFMDQLPTLPAALARWLVRRAGVVVVLSEEWQRRLSARLPGAFVHVVANGVTTSVAAHAAGRLGTPCFVFLGSLGRRKGVPILLQAAAQANVPWLLCLAGSDEEAGFAAQAQNDIVHLGLVDRVRFLGPVVGAAKQKMLAGAQGFVLPSLAEGLPMALLEAMAMQLPVVVTAVGAMPEVVRNGVDGLVVQPNDATALATALDSLALQPALRVRYGESAAHRCAALYGIERMVDALLAVYAILPARRS